MNVSCQGAASPPRQRAFPFFLEVHDKLTKSWHPPYSACLGMSTSSTFTSVDCAEEKAYEKLSPLDESVAAHACPLLSDGRLRCRKHPCSVGLLRPSLDAPTPLLTTRLQCITLWPHSRSFRPNSSAAWMSPDLTLRLSRSCAACTDLAL